MIKRSLKDFNYDIKLYKLYRKYIDQTCIKDLNKLNRTIWKMKLRDYSMVEDRDYYKLTLKR